MQVVIGDIVIAILIVIGIFWLVANTSFNRNKDKSDADK